MKIKATYIGPKDFTGFEPGKEYKLTIGQNNFTRESIIWAEKENLRAKYATLKSFFNNFDNVSLLKNKKNATNNKSNHQNEN